MHLLRARKKGKTDDDAPPLPPMPSGKSFLKRNKAAPAPEQPDLQVTIDTALPSSDDFRLSLLMPNLANRFSILKEQEAAAAAASQGRAGQGAVSGGVLEVGDPQYNSRRSSNLGDIAESDSTHDSAQSSNRYTSKSDESRSSETRVSEDGSMMGRGRTGDGNVLFGGRQKIYKIPNKALRGGTSSTEDLRSESPAPSGRALYQPDLRDPASATTRPKYGDEEPLKISTDGIDQPEYNKNRYTSSSTNSTPASMNGARGSTAGTSINSQQASLPSKSVPQSPTAPSKPRKALYEQALDQQIQEQQTSAMGRLERLASLTRQQNSSPPPSRNESPLSGNFSRMHGSPTSPHSVRTLPWPSMDSATVAPLSPGSRKGSQNDVAPTSPLADFDFGLPIRPAPKVPSRTPSPIRDSRASSVSQYDSPVVAPLSPRGGAPERIIEETHNSGSRPTFLSTSSDGESYVDQDLVMQQIEQELKTEKRKSALSTTNSIMSRGRPLSGIGSVASSLSDRSTKSDDQVHAHEPLNNPQASATSPQFLTDIHPADHDSPTLPQGGGLSLLVRQHLRSDSGSSSIYAGSTYARQSRMSRMSRYGDHAPQLPVTDLGVGKEKRASGSSAGNMWQYEEFDTSPYDREGTKDDTGSPTSIYPATIHGPPSPPPAIPAIPQIPIRTEEPERSGSSIGQRSDSRTGQRSDSRTGQRSDSRTGQRSDSRTGRRPELDRNNSSSARSVSRPAERSPPLNDGDTETDWEVQLAYRRQIIQQNLRNQEKIQSQHDMAWEAEALARAPTATKSPPSGAFQALRAKTSNGFLKGETKSSPKIEQQPRLMRPGPGRASEERVRQGPANGLPLRPGLPGSFSPPGPRPGIAHNNTHPGPGPNGMSGPGPRGPPQRPRRPSDQALAANGEMERPPRSPLNPSPRLRHQGSREQMAGTRSGESTPRGAPMGWNDQHPSRTPRTQPSTPVTPSTPSTPVSAPLKGPQGLHDDLARAMMTGQSQTDTDRFVTPRRPGLTREPSAEDVKSTFESSSRRSNFMRPRGNSILSPSPSSADLTKHSNPPPLPITPSSVVESDPRGVTPPKSPDADLILAIQTTNAAYQPARKRTVSKHNISTPTLVSSTNSITTIDLPPMPPMPAIHAAAVATARPHKKISASPLERFGFGRRTSEEAPANPTGLRSDDDSERKVRLAKLRKSKSDGGGLSSRMKRDMAAVESMPKVNANMVRHPMVMRTDPVVVGGEGVGGARMI